MSRYPPLSPSRHVLANSLCKKRSTEKKFHECAIETKNSTSVQDEIGETVLFHADICNSILASTEVPSDVAYASK